MRVAQIYSLSPSLGISIVLMVGVNRFGCCSSGMGHDSERRQSCGVGHHTAVVDTGLAVLVRLGATV